MAFEEQGFHIDKWPALMQSEVVIVIAGAFFYVHTPPDK